jgi:hypothetical protein
MLSQYFTRRCVLSWLRAGLFGPYLEQLADSLHQQGYSRTEICTCLYASDKFGRWMSRQGHGIDDVTPALVQNYFDELKRTRDTQRPKAGRSLNHLVKLLCRQGLLREPSEQPATEAERWLVLYDTYLERVVGSALNTHDRHETIVRRFLVGRCGVGPVCWDTLSADHVASLLASCDSMTAIAQRDHAVLLFLARLGLRAGELVQLHLEDFDWHRNSVEDGNPGKNGNAAEPPFLADMVANLTACFGRCTKLVLQGNSQNARSFASHTNFTRGAAALNSRTVSL